MTTFTVATEPRGWARPRRNGATGAWYVDAETRAAKSEIALAYRQAAPGVPVHEGPVSVVVEARFAKPGSWPVWKHALDDFEHTSKPDSDNVSKLILDSLNHVAWRDDAQVFDVRVLKLWSSQPGLTITICRHPPAPRTFDEHRRATA